MIERLPKNCFPLLDNLARSVDKGARLGVDICCTAGGKNKFQLKIDLCSPSKIYYLAIGYNTITVPGIGCLFNAIYPDFLLKKTKFMPLSKLVDEFKIDKEQLAFEIMKRIRAVFKDNLKYDCHEEGVSINLSTDSYVSWSESNANAMTPKFKSFSEFLVWADLNVK
jgi:hypothetical protein